MAQSQVSLCNMALAQVPAKSISSLSEASLEAVECGRVFDQCVQELLEAHPYRWARRRVTLAAVTNDRDAEWQYAYALPNNVASVGRMLPDFTAATSTNMVLLEGQRLAVWYPWQPDPFKISYELADGVIYTNEAGAGLEYTTSDLLPSAFPARFAQALVLELASRIVMPLLKSRERQGDLLKAAETAKQRAIADDLNTQPGREYEFVSEMALARGW